jgi:hypothetical protein
VAQGVNVKDVASPNVAEVVEELVVGMKVTSKFTVSALLAVTALVVVMGVATWQFNSSTQAAGRFPLFRGSSWHALTSAGGLSANPTAIGAGAATGCGSAAPATSQGTSCGAP